MAYDEKLGARVRALLASKRGCSEKKMFGGIAFMLGDKMCCGVLDNDLMARVGPDAYAAALRKPHVREMDFTGRPLTGYVYVGPAAIRTSRSLQAWLDQSMAFVATLPAKKKKTKNR